MLRRKASPTFNGLHDWMPTLPWKLPTDAAGWALPYLVCTRCHAQVPLLAGMGKEGKRHFRAHRARLGPCRVRAVIPY